MEATTPVKEGTRRHELTVMWNNYSADYQYVYTEHVADGFGNETKFNTAYGDRDWADRIANHYKLDLPEQPKD